MKLTLVHGFNVKDKGTRTTDTLAPYAEEFFEVDKDEGDYGYFNLFAIRLFNRKQRDKVIFRLAQAFATSDVIITHSNGAYFTTLALGLLGDNFNKTKTVVHISPALNSSTPIPDAVKAQLVLYTPHDGWVKAASYLPLNPWGRMGARGYTGDSYKNVNIMDARIKKHSEWFAPKFQASTWRQSYCFIEEHI